MQTPQRELWMVTPITVGTAVTARSLASAIPGAVGGTPSCWRNASVRPARGGRGLFARARFLQRGKRIGPELLRVRRKRGADAPLYVTRSALLRPFNLRFSAQILIRCWRVR